MTWTYNCIVNDYNKYNDNNEQWNVTKSNPNNYLKHIQ